jgi:hypothetical protein
VIKPIESKEFNRMEKSYKKKLEGIHELTNYVSADLQANKRLKTIQEKVENDSDAIKQIEDFNNLF